MQIKLLVSAAAIALVATIGAAHAADVNFSTLADVPAVKITSDQMAQVRGLEHVLGMLGRIGVSLGTATADSMTANASKNRSGDVGNDVNVIPDLFN